jgi:hypothetical protein
VRTEGEAQVADFINNLDGAWYAAFGSKLAGDGMVLLRNGTLLGCDNQYFYEGAYELGDDGRLRARIDVCHYACDQPVSIFGSFESLTLERFQADLQGVEVAGRLLLNGTVNGDPERTLAVSLTRFLPKAPAG